MVARNPHFAKLKMGYLFPEINKRKKAYLEKHPDAKIISLGIGDTTQPIAPHITQGLVNASIALGTYEGYTGYGQEPGQPALRKKISDTIYQGRIPPQDIFVSDGAKCDIGRLQTVFGSQATIAVQDPSYPVYVDTSIMLGQPNIAFLPCLPENGFFPDLTKAPKTDLIYFCSPNNPTGAAATHEQLESLVAFAKKNRSIIIFDAAYSIYIRNPSLPRSIYEIKGAEEVAIELGSFSKMAGFTGIRLAWSVIPEPLVFDDGTRVKKDWDRLVATFFNGASNIAQAGGIAALDDQGFQEMMSQVSLYLHNAQLIKSVLEDDLGLPVYGGIDAPYVWANFGKRSSWEIFDELLENAQVIATPGSGFGPAGEGFLRFSAFGRTEDVKEALVRLKKIFIKIA